MTFCQVVLNTSLINSVPKNPYHLKWWAEKVHAHTAKYPQDPISIPFQYVCVVIGVTEPDA